MSRYNQSCATGCDVRLHPVDDDAPAGSRDSASGRNDVTSQRRAGTRDVADHVTDLLVRQCKSWTTKLSGTEDQDNMLPSTTLFVTSAVSSSASPATVSRPPPSPRPSLTSPARPSDRLSSLVKSDCAVDSPSAYFFTSNSTEDVVVVDAGLPGSGAASSDTSSGRGSASPDTRLSSRGKSRFKKMLRPLRRTRSAGCSDDFQKFADSAHKTTGVQQVTSSLCLSSVNSATSGLNALLSFLSRLKYWCAEVFLDFIFYYHFFPFYLP